MGPNYTRLGKYTDMKMFDVKLKKFLDVHVELVKLSNGRFAVTGVNPETGMTMFKLVKKDFAREILGEVVI